jgi:hypothetical protein
MYHTSYMSRIVVLFQSLQKMPHSSEVMLTWQIQYHTPTADIIMILWSPHMPGARTSEDAFIMAIPRRSQQGHQPAMIHQWVHQLKIWNIL